MNIRGLGAVDRSASDVEPSSGDPLDVYGVGLIAAQRVPSLLILAHIEPNVPAAIDRHLADFIAAYNFGRRLKTLKGLTPYEFICKCWTSEPQRFTLDPIHQIPGLNSTLA